MKVSKEHLEMSWLLVWKEIKENSTILKTCVILKMCYGFDNTYFIILTSTWLVNFLSNKILKLPQWFVL